MKSTGLSLKWLEAFEAAARTGSVRAAAARLEISVSTASHHLKCLEAAAGRPLLDHGRRPMRLTPAGAVMLRHAETSLGALRRSMSEIRSGDLAASTGSLRLASIEDFDGRAIPALAAALAERLPESRLSFLSRPGHEVVALLQAEDADLGLASPMEPPEGLRARALLHDPYLVVVPAARSEGAEAYLRGEAALPFLRYSLKQLIGRRIEAQLRRLRAELPRRFEFESTRTILSLVAQGRAWTITTALNLAATPEVSAGLRALPLPDAAFSRRIALLQREDLHPRLLDEVEALLRPLLEAEVVAPMLAREPGLEGVFRLLEDQ